MLKYNRVQPTNSEQLTITACGVPTEWVISPESRAHPRAVPSVEAHHHVNCPDTERNSGGRQITKKNVAKK